jgi:hypothetical protein
VPTLFPRQRSDLNHDPEQEMRKQMNLQWKLEIQRQIEEKKQRQEEERKRDALEGQLYNSKFVQQHLSRVHDYTPLPNLKPTQKFVEKEYDTPENRNEVVKIYGGASLQSRIPRPRKVIQETTTAVVPPPSTTVSVPKPNPKPKKVEYEPLPPKEPPPVKVSSKVRKPTSRPKSASVPDEPAPKKSTETATIQSLTVTEKVEPKPLPPIERTPVPVEFEVPTIGELNKQEKKISLKPVQKPSVKPHQVYLNSCSEFREIKRMRCKD